MKKVLVIGGSGFMGSHTADELSNKGYQVSIFDCVKSPYLRSDQEMVVGDIFNKNQLEKAMLDVNIVYYFAGVADIGDAKDNPEHTINMNVTGIADVLHASVNAKIERFVYASTMYVYSSHGSFYRASKQCAEIIIEAYSEEFALDYTLLRYGSLYGPRAQEWNGLRKYVDQVVKTGRLDYRGTGRERREYIHVVDAAILSVKVLDDAHKNRAITVTGHQVLNSKTLINMIFEISNVEYNANFEDENIDHSHYETTPYRYTPKNAMKLVPLEFIDIGQGILDLVEQVSSEHNKNN
ncbi:NAD-dependent epimerase/dehydratase family protein [Patescibacteria group bacterium]|nr:NAD-dependent epimerase/dehydratase family protein [Patescibacteria group bacterium]